MLESDLVRIRSEFFKKNSAIYDEYLKDLANAKKVELMDAAFNNDIMYEIIEKFLTENTQLSLVGFIFLTKDIRLVNKKFYQACLYQLKTLRAKRPELEREIAVIDGVRHVM
jgi:hypothetical protein